MLKSILKLDFAVPIADFKIWQNLEKIAILSMDNYDIVSKHQNFDKKRKKIGKIWKKFGKIWKNLEKIAILNVKSNSKNLLCSKVFHFRP